MLDGSLATIAASVKDPVPTTASQIKLRRVTAALADHLISSRFGRDDAKHVNAVPPSVQISCDGCLLAATAGRALVHLDGANPMSKSANSSLGRTRPPPSRLITPMSALHCSTCSRPVSIACRSPAHSTATAGWPSRTIGRGSALYGSGRRRRCTSSPMIFARTGWARPPLHPTIAALPRSTAQAFGSEVAQVESSPK